MSTVLCAILLIQAEPKITLDLPISPLKEIARQVSLQTHVEHQIIGPEPDHWIFVRVKEMPASRLREAIAKATGGKWMKAGDAWALQTVEIQSHQDKAFAKSMASWKAAQKSVTGFDLPSYEEAMKKAAQLSKAGQGYDYREMNKLEEGAPDKRLLRRLVQSLPLAELSSLRANETRVYSLQPTSLQRQLPSQAASAFADFIKEAAAVSGRVDAVLPESEDGQYYNFLAAPYRSGLRITEAQKFLLVLSRESLSSELAQAEVMLFDRMGSRIHNSTMSISSSGFSGLITKVEGTKVFEGLDQKLEVSAEEEAFAKDLLGALGGLREGQKREPIRKSTTQRLLNMDKVDPLTFGPTEVMRAFASAKKKQVVARISDLAVLSLAFAFQPQQGSIGPPLAMASMVTTGALGAENPDIQDEADLIVFPPISSSSLPDFKMPRKVTADLLRAADQDRDLLDPLSIVASVSGGYEDVMLPAMLTGMFGSNQPIQPDPSTFDLLKLYGLLPTNQKQMVRQGGLELSIDNLPPAILKQVRQMLLGRRGSFTALTPEMKEAVSKNEITLEQLEDMASNSYSSPEKYEMVPSVFLAGPNARGGTLRIHMSTKSVTLVATRYGSMRETTPEQIAWSIRSQESNPSVQMESERYGQGRQMKLTATFTFSGTGIRSFVMTLPKLAPGVELKELKDMPAEFREEVKKSLEEIRKIPISRGGTGDGGAIKPPFK